MFGYVAYNDASEGRDAQIVPETNGDSKDYAIVIYSIDIMSGLYSGSAFHDLDDLTIKFPV